MYLAPIGTPGTTPIRTNIVSSYPPPHLPGELRATCVFSLFKISSHAHIISTSTRGSTRRSCLFSAPPRGAFDWTHCWLALLLRWLSRKCTATKKTSSGTEVHTPLPLTTLGRFGLSVLMVEFSRGGVQRRDCVDVGVGREKEGLFQGKVCSEGLNYLRRIRLPRLGEELFMFRVSFLKVSSLGQMACRYGVGQMSKSYVCCRRRCNKVFSFPS